MTYTAVKPHKDYSGRRTAACVDQFAEIAVFGDEHALAFGGILQHLIVARAPGDFGDSNHIMTCFPQSPNYRHGAAFVSDEVHV